MKVGSKFKTLPRQAFCHFCGEQKPNLPICKRCEMVHYCSREHQMADHPHHNTNCRLIAEHIEMVSEEAERLRDHTWLTDPYGKFFTLPETRHYMYLQTQLGVLLGSFGTPEGVNAQLELFLKLLLLGRLDNGMLLRTYIPPLMLRLGKDQECYDFLKWWGTTPVHSPCFHDIYLPYLNLKGSNAYEDHKWIFSSSSLELPMVVALMLLKIRLYLDLKLVQRAFPPCADTIGSSGRAKDSQKGSGKSIKGMVIEGTTQEAPAIWQPSEEFTSLRYSNRQADAQQFNNIPSSDDTASTAKDTEKTTPNNTSQTNKSSKSNEAAERYETSDTKSQSLKPLSNAARIIPCIRSNIVINTLEHITHSNHSCMIAKLETDISELYKLINQLNARFWGDLLNSSKVEEVDTCFIEPSGISESYSAVHVSHKSWYETPGAIEMERRLDIQHTY
ncbi:hypothetical protein PspLS_02268 [Pyricularia sp. CBS 133598]|nr:hypothetical protein PspLS_02268 [Pyricularia sp. CBS 133598]